MKININDLAQMVADAGSACDAKPTNQVNALVVVRSDGKTVSVQANGTLASIRVTREVKASDEPEEFVMEFDPLIKWLRVKIAGGAKEIKLKKLKAATGLSVDGSSAKLPEFVHGLSMPEVKNPSSPIEMQMGDLCSKIMWLGRINSEKEFSPVTMGISVWQSDGKLKMASTDLVRIAMLWIPKKEDLGITNSVISMASAMSLVRLQHITGIANLVIGSQAIGVTCGGLEFVGGMIDTQKLPNFDGVHDMFPEDKAIVSSLNFRKAVASASAITQRGSDGTVVDIKMSPGKMNIIGRDDMEREYEETIDIDSNIEAIGRFGTDLLRKSMDMLEGEVTNLHAFIKKGAIHQLKFSYPDRSFMVAGINISK